MTTEVDRNELKFEFLSLQIRSLGRGRATGKEGKTYLILCELESKDCD